MSDVDSTLEAGSTVSHILPEDAKYYTATQWQLMWWKFKKHRLALLGLFVLTIFTLMILFAEFIAPYSPMTRNTNYLIGPPQKIHFIDPGGAFHLRPFVYGKKAERDPETLRLHYIDDTTIISRLHFFGRGETYKVLGLFEVNIHLFGTESAFVHLLGTDDLGRDLLSRMIHGTRISLSIGVIGVFLSFVIGLAIGGVSGYFGGRIDYFLQRFTEIIRSIPAIPLWMALAAALPREWSGLQVYFAISTILGILGWTYLAQRVRGAFFSIKKEDFIMAAKVGGSSEARIIVRHMIPAFGSYIIAHLTIWFPTMLLAETSLSYLGLGLRPPVVSWGVLLQAAQNVKAITQSPWLFSPGAFIILAVLAFSFVGDGLRDAADPYSR